MLHASTCGIISPILFQPPPSWSTVEAETDATTSSTLSDATTAKFPDVPTARQTDATTKSPATDKSPGAITVSGPTDATTVKSPDATTSSTENGINLSASLTTSTELRALFYQTTLEPFSVTHKTSLIVIILLSSLVLFLIISLIITCRLYIKRRKYVTYMPPGSVELRERRFRTDSNDDNFSVTTASTDTYLEPGSLQRNEPIYHDVE